MNNQVSKDGTSYSIFSHVLGALSFSSDTPPKSALVLGLGVGMIPTYLSQKGVSVDAVELDGTVVGIARDFFSFNDSNISVSIEDARTFVRKCSKKYDVVVIDLYNGDGIPAHVVSKEFFNDIKACVSENGAVLMNAFYGVKNLSSKKALLKTISDVFGSVIAFEAPLKSDADITQGYLLAKNVIGNWSFSITLDDVTEIKQKKVIPILQNWVAYNREHEFFNDTETIQDGSNDWVRQANYVDVTYRRILTQIIPWQILLD